MIYRDCETRRIKEGGEREGRGMSIRDRREEERGRGGEGEGREGEGREGKKRGRGIERKGREEGGDGVSMVSHDSESHQRLHFK